MAKKSQEVEELSDTKEIINEIISETNSSKDNDFSITLNSEIKDIPKIRSGNISFDKALGGGTPLGRVMEIFGSESNGKSTIAEVIAGTFQKEDGIAIYIDTEYALIPERAEDLGVNMDNLILAQPNDVESVFKFIEYIIKKIRNHNTTKPVVIIWDSVAATPSRQELEGDYDDKQPALKARAMSKGFSKIMRLISKSNVSLICINQERENVGIMFGSKKTTPGGKALKFYSSIRLETSKREIIKKDNVPVGINIRIKVVKNKVAPPFKEAELKILFNHEGIDKYGDLLEYGKSIGLFGKSKGWYDIRGKKMRLGQAKEMIKEDPELFDELYEQVWNGELDADIEEDEHE